MGKLKRGRTCARRGCNRPPVPIPSRVRYGTLRDYLSEPFCSRACCEAYYAQKLDAEGIDHALTDARAWRDT